MNLTEYTSRLGYRLEKVARGRAFTPEMMEAQLPDVLNELARRVYLSDSRARLEKVYTATLTSGAVDLGASPFLDLWFSSMRTARVMYPVDVSFNVKAEFYENPSDLDLPKPKNVYAFSLIGNTLILRDEVGQVPANTAALLVTASKIPVLTELGALNLDGDLLGVGTEFAMRSPQMVEAKAAEV